jgi:hypothetical protein
MPFKTDSLKSKEINYTKNKERQLYLKGFLKIIVVSTKKFETESFFIENKNATRKKK